MPASVALVVTEAGDQPRQARRAAGRSCCAAARRARRRRASRCWRSTAGRAWPTSAAACATATRPPARRAPASARSRGCRDVFDVYSAPAARDRARWRVCGASRRREPRHVRGRRGRRVPMPGETVCGDAWACADAQGRRALLLVADGLGHGIAAARAAASSRRGFVEQRPAAAVRRSCRALHARARAARAARRSAVRRDRLRDRDRSASPASATSPACIVTGAASAQHGVAQRHRRARGAQDPGVRLPVRREAPLVILHSDGLGDALGPRPLPRARRAASGADRRRALPRPSPRPRRRDGRRRARAAQDRHEQRLLADRAAPRARTSSLAAPARAADRGAARLRRAGPDAHRHRRLGDRAQRLPATPAAAGSSSV